MGRVEIRTAPAFDDVLTVARNMRERDRAEIYATTYGADPTELARNAVATGDFRWGAYLDGRPVAMFGAYPRWPRVWTAWAFATDDFHRVAVSMTRHMLRFCMPALLASGAHRVDAMALASHRDSRSWMEITGARAEFTVENWGKNGEKFVQYVWTRQALHAAVKRQRRPRRQDGRPASPPRQSPK